MLLPNAAAQLEVATRITPWPPPLWPPGVQGEVRAVTYGELETVFSFPIGETGEVTYSFPETLPRSAERFFEPVLLDTFQMCPEVSPVLSPPGVEVVLLQLLLYADDRIWGELDISAVGGDLFTVDARSFAGLIYAREPFQVVGAGYCTAQEQQVQMAMSLQPGLNLLEISAYGSLMGGITSTFTTTETFDLPQTPVGGWEQLE